MGLQHSGLDDQDTPLAADDLFGVWDASDGATEKVTAGVIRTFMQDGLAGGLSLADADPADPLGIHQFPAMGLLPAGIITVMPPAD